MDEFVHACNGYGHQVNSEWDRTRHIMFAVVKAAGGKIKRPSDILELAIDKDEETGRARLRGKLNSKRFDQLKKAHLEYYGSEPT